MKKEKIKRKTEISSTNRISIVVFSLHEVKPKIVFNEWMLQMKKVNRSDFYRTNIIILVIILFIHFLLIPLLNKEDSENNPIPKLNEIVKNGKEDFGVASDNPIATKIGMEVLENSGNAVDASIAVAYTLNVVEPSLSGIGGGGTLMVMEPDEEPIVYDYRETAPKDGNISSKGIGVMGFVKGMEEVHDDYGDLPMDALMEYAINIAENGFEVSETLHERLEGADYRLDDEELPYLFPNGEAVKEGTIIKQPEMAETLQLIQKEGTDAFYEGDIAEEINDEVPSIELSDLEDYEVEVKEPLSVDYKGYTVYLPPPPSGGIMIGQQLSMAKYLDYDETYDFYNNISITNRLAYRERYEKVGDPNFVDVETDKMLEEEHIKELVRNKDEDLQTKLDSKGDMEDHANTTHFVVIDKDGMMVSSTNTLSNFFGSGETVEGFFLNNQLDNFSLSESSPNELEGGKRPFSYTSPMIVAEDGEPILGIGSSGGRRITSVLTSILVHYFDQDVPLQEAIDKPRFFMELNEDVIFFEDEIDNELEEKFESDDFEVREDYRSVYFGSVEALAVEDGEIVGGSDKRRNGKWLSN
ncbi:gamma-glutamyltransferase family protein [Oceanobacillus senegalensis]|uniref:gamma-glutamyltransferase family protein n=1 Tax=Oceanobacillus senegalensis TaxID=1936063 RepID=UPI001C4F8A6B|nr:gamma-glutamyltransferase family protein [Oceanobacillus senegalensis]